MGMKLETSCSLAEILGNPVQDQWDSDREDMVAFKFLHHHVSSCIVTSKDKFSNPECTNHRVQVIATM